MNVGVHIRCVHLIHFNSFPQPEEANEASLPLTSLCISGQNINQVVDTRTLFWSSTKTLVQEEDTYTTTQLYVSYADSIIIIHLLFHQNEQSIKKSVIIIVFTDQEE
jgi:hypothetical protein